MVILNFLDSISSIYETLQVNSHKISAPSVQFCAEVLFSYTVVSPNPLDFI